MKNNNESQLDFADNNAPEQSLTLGKILAVKRQELGLSIEDIADQLKISTTMVQHIENDAYEQIKLADVYVRGHVKNYAKLLKIDPAIVSKQTSNLGTSEPNNFAKTSTVFEQEMNKKKYPFWHKNISWLILLILIIIAGLWWWQSFQDQTVERDTFVSDYLATSSETPSLDTAPEPNNIISAKNVNHSTADNIDLDTFLTTLDSSSIDTISAEPKSSETTIPKTIISEPMISESIRVEVAEPIAADQSLASIIQQYDLVFEVKGEAWISIKDANNKKIIEKLYNKPEIIKLSGHTKYTIVIGNSSNVTLYYKTEKVDLKLKSKNNVARITLP